MPPAVAIGYGVVETAPVWGPALVNAATWIGGGILLAVGLSSDTPNADTQADAQTKADTATCATGNCPPEDKCKFDKYNKLKCGENQQKHHIIADYVIRAGKRLDDSLRLPNAPSLDDGPSICLDDTEHNSVHRQMDAAIKNLGPDATLGQVKDIAMAAIKKVKPECEGKMDDLKSQVDKAFEKMGDEAPVRHQKRPLPNQNQIDRLFGRGLGDGLE